MKPADERPGLLAPIRQLTAPFAGDLLATEEERRAEQGRSDERRAEQRAEHAEHLHADGRPGEQPEPGHQPRSKRATERLARPATGWSRRTSQRRRSSVQADLLVGQQSG